jgi:predicted GNAT family N-acyltransferase
VGSPPPAIRWAAGRHDIDGALALRERVFCGEQGVPLQMEIDGLDPQAEHLVAVSEPDARVVGTLRLLVDNGTAKVGRVAVDAACRREGIALRMLLIAIERARERGCVRARLAAQLVATDLYRRAGFEVESGPFYEAGIEHVWMGRALEGRDDG